MSESTWNYIKRLYSGRARKKEILQNSLALEVARGLPLKNKKRLASAMKKGEKWEWGQYKFYKRMIGKKGNTYHILFNSLTSAFFIGWFFKSILIFIVIFMIVLCANSFRTMRGKKKVKL